MGFTIVETLVAIAVLMLAIAAPLTLAERSLSSAQIAQREVTGFYLAQEAIEFVRNIKDTNSISGEADWLLGLNDCLVANPKGCGVDPTSTEGNTIIDCSEVLQSDACLLSQNDTTRVFGYPSGHSPGTGAGWTATEFTRKVSIDEFSPAVEARITVTVEWGKGTPQERTVTVSSNIFNWYNSP